MKKITIFLILIFTLIKLYLLSKYFILDSHYDNIVDDIVDMSQIASLLYPIELELYKSYENSENSENSRYSQNSRHAALPCRALPTSDSGQVTST